ncbi:MAG TPA: hypothetical protein VJS67_00365 [Pseudonocardiaceae bacterium]|nr:hypothetical protein [Pseudonocardiaceae bacterium]
MAELSCPQCQELAEELALGVLSCHQRADALAHLEGCSSCQDKVSALTATADRLVELLPPVEPPTGFEQRVISALTLSPPPPTQRWRQPVATGLAAIALATSGWTLGRMTHNLPPPEASPQTQTGNDGQAGERAVLYAPLTTAQQDTAAHQVGQAYLYPGHPSWIYLSLDAADTTTSGTVSCELMRRDGSAVPLGSFALINGHGTWGGPAPVDRDTFAGAKLINSNGHTLANARFGGPRNASGQHSPRRHPEHHLRGHS